MSEWILRYEAEVIYRRLNDRSTEHVGKLLSHPVAVSVRTGHCHTTQRACLSVGWRQQQLARHRTTRVYKARRGGD